MKNIKAYKSVIYLVPDLIKNEKINIGIVLTSDVLQQVKIDKDKIDISIFLNPKLDIEHIKLLIRDMNIKLMELYGEDKVKDVPKLYNGILRFTEFEGLITYDLDKELKILMKQYVKLDK